MNESLVFDASKLAQQYQAQGGQKDALVLAYEEQVKRSQEALDKFKALHVHRGPRTVEEFKELKSQ